METTADKIQADIDIEKQETADKCPDCGTIMRVFYFAHGEDDYYRTWECPKCGLSEQE